MTDCITDNEWVEPRIDRVLTQYRESPKLLHMMRTYLGQIERVAQSICDLPSFFQIDSAVGDQLTILGKRLGWPRCHCVCDKQPVFGFECGDLISEQDTSGFCDDSVTWANCGEIGVGEVCLEDDEVYRKFLKVRCFQFTQQFDIFSLEECLRILWGADSFVAESGNRRVVVSPGRELTDVEISLLQLYPRILPVALGIQIRFYFGKPSVFGFGAGWGGFCEAKDATNIETEAGDELVTENDVQIITGSLTEGAPWLCEVQIDPYGC